MEKQERAKVENENRAKLGKQRKRETVEEKRETGERERKGGGELETRQFINLSGEEKSESVSFIATFMSWQLAQARKDVVDEGRERERK